MSNNKKSGVYKITNNITGVMYIGSSSNIGSRWDTHRRSLRNNVHHSKYMQRSYNKYGKECLDFEVILYCPKEENLAIEQYLLDYYQPKYNSLKVAGSNLGTKASQETKDKIRKAMLGRTYSEETLKRMSDGQKGRIVSKETREKFRLAKLGKDFIVRRRPVAQLHLNTNIIINIFGSIKEAEKELNTCNISSVARGKRPNAAGYSWKYVKDLN